MLLLQNPHIRDLIIQCDCGREYLHFYLDEDASPEAIERYCVGLQYISSFNRKHKQYFFEFEDLEGFKNFVKHLDFQKNSPEALPNLGLISYFKDNYFIVSEWDKNNSFYRFDVFRLNRKGNRVKKLEFEILIDEFNLLEMEEELKKWLNFMEENI